MTDKYSQVRCLNIQELYPDDRQVQSGLVLKIQELYPDDRQTQSGTCSQHHHMNWVLCVEDSTITMLRCSHLSTSVAILRQGIVNMGTDTSVCGWTDGQQARPVMARVKKAGTKRKGL